MIEGAASYGSVLAGAVASSGYQVIDAARMDTRARYDVGKSEELYAQRSARAVPPLEETELHWPRLGDRVRATLRILVSARDSLTGERTRAVIAVIALTALVRVDELGVDARKASTGAQNTEVSR